jgi:hypothetical protein
MKNKFLWLILILISTTISLACTQNKLPNDGWKVIKIEAVSRQLSNGTKLLIGSNIYFENGIQAKSDLIGMRYIDQLPVAGAPPFLIFSGRGCDKCDMNTSIYILSPTDGSLIKAAKSRRYPFPGKVFAFGPAHTLIRVSRLFIGNCSQGRGPIAVWFINSKLNSDKWEKSVFIAEVKNGILMSKFLVPPLPDINETLQLLHKHQCYEIPGKDMVEEP